MSLALRVSGYNRDRKWKLFNKLFNFDNETKILDVGFNEIEYSPKDNYIENYYPFKNKITALGIDEPIEFKKRYPEVRAVSYAGKVFPFADKEFDICWSNAVLEHVGDWDSQVQFIREIKRTSNKAFVTTPNRLFPIEVHTKTFLLHFLPKKIFYKFLKFSGKEWATGDYMSLLSINQIKKILREAGVTNFKIYKNKILFFTLDFVITF